MAGDGGPSIALTTVEWVLLRPTENIFILFKTCPCVLLTQSHLDVLNWRAFYHCLIFFLFVTFDKVHVQNMYSLAKWKKKHIHVGVKIWYFFYADILLKLFFVIRLKILLTETMVNYFFLSYFKLLKCTQGLCHQWQNSVIYYWSKVSLKRKCLPSRIKKLLEIRSINDG